MRYLSGVWGESLANAALQLNANLHSLREGLSGTDPDEVVTARWAIPSADSLGMARTGELAGTTGPVAYVDEAMVELITSGAFDQLPRPPYYAELSRSRMGWDADVELATMLIEELTVRDLARPSEDGVSLPLHPVVRQTILVILAQLARAAGHRAGVDLHPVTSEPNAIDALRSTLELTQLPSAGNVIALDLKTVAVDLQTVPLDEILAFRDQNGALYRAYMRRLREFVSQLAAIEDSTERARALADRQEELQDEAKQLEVASRLAFNRPTVGYGLAIAGSTWTAATQDPIGAALALAGWRSQDDHVLSQPAPTRISLQRSTS